MRKDRGHVLRRDKRRTGTNDRDKASKVQAHRTVPPQDGRKRSSACGGGGKLLLTGMPPDQVLIHAKTYVFEIPCWGANCWPGGNLDLKEILGPHTKFHGNVACGC